MDEDDPWLRQPWEDADPPPRQTLGGPATGTEALLVPLARAQDAVARLKASIAAARDSVRAAAPEAGSPSKEPTVRAGRSSHPSFAHDSPGAA